MTKIEKTTTQLPRPSPAALQATLVTISAAYLPSVTKASTVIQHNDHGGLTIVVDYITLQMVLVTGIFVDCRLNPLGRARRCHQQGKRLDRLQTHAL